MLNIEKDSLMLYNKLNQKLIDNNISGLEITIIGGEVGRTLLGEEYRATSDIDFLMEQEVTPEIMKIIMSSGLHPVGVSTVPPVEDYKYEDSLNLSNVRINIPSIEDFALSKLMTDRGKDEEDLKTYPILDNCDLKLLSEKIEEYKGDLTNPDNFNNNYHYFDDYLKHRKLI
jgi:hypothetical protein